jgi:hypothetical protein
MLLQLDTLTHFSCTTLRFYHRHRTEMKNMALMRQRASGAQIAMLSKDECATAHLPVSLLTFLSGLGKLRSC